MTPSLEQVRALKRANEERWLALPGVVGVGIGRGPDGGYRLLVSIDAGNAHSRREIPEEVEGVAVEIRITGPVRAR